MSQIDNQRIYIQIYNKIEKANLMSCILKVAYLHKHKKYRYYQEKPINFHQMRQELGIHQSSSAVIYHLELPSQVKSEKINQRLTLKSEEEVSNTLKQLILEPGKTIKMKLSVQNQPKIREEGSEVHSDNQDLCIPISIQKIRSKSDEIDLSKQPVQVTDNMEITQQFLCNSHVEWFKVQKSKELEEVEKELTANSQRLRLLQAKKGCSSVQKLTEFWERMSIEN